MLDQVGPCPIGFRSAVAVATRSTSFLGAVDGAFTAELGHSRKRHRHVGGRPDTLARIFVGVLQPAHVDAGVARFALLVAVKVASGVVARQVGGVAGNVTVVEKVRNRREAFGGEQRGDVVLVGRVSALRCLKRPPHARGAQRELVRSLMRLLVRVHLLDCDFRGRDTNALFLDPLGANICQILLKCLLYSGFYGGERDRLQHLGVIPRSRIPLLYEDRASLIRD